MGVLIGEIMTRELYRVSISVRNKEGKLFDHPRTGMFTGFKFWEYYNDYVAMESEFKLLHEELKMLMPENNFSISASLPHDNFGTGVTYSQMAALYGNENRFVIF